MIRIKRRYESENQTYTAPRHSVVIRKDDRKITAQVKPVGYIGRKSELLRLARSVFIENVPIGFFRQPQLFHAALPTINRLAENGGPEYNRALLTLKFAFKPLNPEGFNPKGPGPRDVVFKKPNGEYGSYKNRIWYDTASYKEAVDLLVPRS